MFSSLDMRNAGPLGLLAALALLLALTGSPDAIAFTAPFFAFAIALTVGRTPGDTLVRRLGSILSARPRVVSAPAVGRLEACCRVRAVGPIADHFGGRAPPVGLVRT